MTNESPVRASIHSWLRTLNQSISSAGQKSPPRAGTKSNGWRSPLVHLRNSLEDGGTRQPRRASATRSSAPATPGNPNPEKGPAAGLTPALFTASAAHTESKRSQAALSITLPFKNRVTALKSVCDQARADAERVADARDRPGPSIAPQAPKTSRSAGACGPRRLRDGGLDDPAARRRAFVHPAAALDSLSEAPEWHILLQIP